MELAKSISTAKRVYLIGNGGSAANAMHIANDLFSVGIKAEALTNVATITAIANDYSYEEVFSRQIRIVGEPGDLLIALSGSGRSPNIIAGIAAAEEIGMETWAIVGMFSKPMPAAALIAKSYICKGVDMQDAENIQLEIGHDVLRWLRRSAKAVA